ncbi:MAG: phosphoenolpyruvate--protein phosphotransferase [bacterium]
MQHKKDNEYKGIGAAPGLAFSTVYIYKKEDLEISKTPIINFEEASSQLMEALQKSKKELMKIFSLAVDKLGEKRAAIFEAQIMILDDPILIDTILNRMRLEMLNPEFIVYDEITKYQVLMNSSDEVYMKERSLDIADIKNRIIRNLKNKKWISKITSDVVVVTDTLTPADAVVFARAKVKAFVTDFGGLTSHAAILARSLNIPAVVGLHDATKKINHGDSIIVDGFNGIVIANPNKEQSDYYTQKIIELSQYDKELTNIKSLPAITKDGKKIEILGNLDLVEEIELIFQNGAEGIGLIRTEQFFIESNGFPDEFEQFTKYNQLAQKIYPNNIVIRIFDIGGDKVLPVDVKEPNPFLGWRGIRFLLDNMQLLKTQLRSILKASTLKNINILIPMVASIDEVRKVKDLIELCKMELTEQGVLFDKCIKVGAMIEIPSAAVMTLEYAEEVDFLSIGTNDLIQFLLAVDRGNDIVSVHYQEFHPAVIRTLHTIISQAKASSKQTKVSMCGEMAADILAAPLLIGLGLESFSISPATIPYLKQVILNTNYWEAKELADICLKLKTENEISQLVHKFYGEKISPNVKNIF